MSTFTARLKRMIGEYRDAHPDATVEQVQDYIADHFKARSLEMGRADFIGEANARDEIRRIWDADEGALPLTD